MEHNDDIPEEIKALMNSLGTDTNPIEGNDVNILSALDDLLGTGNYDSTAQMDLDTNVDAIAQSIVAEVTSGQQMTLSPGPLETESKSSPATASTEKVSDVVASSVSAPVTPELGNTGSRRADTETVTQTQAAGGSNTGLSSSRTITTRSSAGLRTSSTGLSSTTRGRPPTRSRSTSTQNATLIPVQPTTPFANIISELSPEGQARMQKLLSLLQGSEISTDEFMAESKKVLNARQYQEMERIRSRVRKDTASSSSTRASPVQSPTSSAFGSQLSSPALPTTSSSGSSASTTAGTQASKFKKRQAEPETGDGSAAMALLAAVASKKPKLETPSSLPLHNAPSSAGMKHNGITSPKDIVLPSPISSNKSMPGQTSKSATSGGYTMRNLTLPGSSSSMAAAPSSSNSGPSEKLDVDALTDVMGYAGIDLREEYENILRDEVQQLSAAGVGGSLVDRSRTQDFLNTDCLRIKVEQIAQSVGIRRPSSDVLNYLALSVQHRLRGLIHAMIAASKHRAFSQPLAPPPLDAETGRPLYAVKIHQDVGRQLQAIEQVARHLEEKRKESLKPYTQGADEGGEGADGTGGGSAETPKPVKRKAKKTKSVSERNLSEDVRKRITNETAMRSAGGKMKSWMLAGLEAINASTAAKSNNGTGDTAGTPGSSTGGASAGSKTAKSDTVTPLHRLKPGMMSRAARMSAAAEASAGTRPITMQSVPYEAHRITVRDAIFCLEQERSARGICRQSLLKTLAQRLN